MIWKKAGECALFTAMTVLSKVIRNQTNTSVGSKREEAHFLYLCGLKVLYFQEALKTILVIFETILVCTTDCSIQLTERYHKT